MNKPVTVSIDYDLSQMTSNITAHIPYDLVEKVCTQLFGTADVELVRDIFEILRRDPKIQDQIVSIRVARRLGVK